MSKSLITQDAEAVIRRLRPDHKTIKWYDGGDNRDVVVVDGVEAFRFPKDEGGIVVGRYEFEALQLVQGRLSVSVPRPIELAPDGSYNVLSFLQGNVLSKHEVAALPFKERRSIGVAIAGVINELNNTVTRAELEAIPSTRTLVRNRDDFYVGVYEIAKQQDGVYAKAYRENFEQLQRLRPEGSASNIIVFGDLSSPNLVLSQDNQLTGLIDWTELGLGDIHNELRPVFSVIGQSASEEMVASLDSSVGPVNLDLVRQLAVVHELSVLVSGKQKGTLKPERIRLAVDSLHQWLGKTSDGFLAGQG